MAYERLTLDILISEELRDLLKQIEGDSEVAKLLLKKRHRKEDLVDSPVNFISVSFDDRSKISYLTNDRIAKINEENYWDSSSRYLAKPGAFLSKLFKNIQPKEVEKFANLFKAVSNKPNFTLQVVSGDDIKKYYHGSTYACDERGSLGASCMKHDNCQRYFNIYTDNKEVSMLAMFDTDDNLIGRALLWDLPEHKIMDRIYAKNDEEYSFYFKKWATENNYLYKSEQNWYNTLNFENLKVKSHEIFLEIKLDNMPYTYPYLDTFKFLDADNGVISNFITPSTTGTLTTTSGDTNDEDSLRFDGISRVYRYRNESVYLTYREFYTSRDNVHYSRLNDMYIAKTDVVWDPIIEDYIFKNESEYVRFNKDVVNQYREQVLNERLEEENARLHVNADNLIVSTGGDIYDVSDVISNITGEIQSGVRPSMGRLTYDVSDYLDWSEPF